MRPGSVRICGRLEDVETLARVLRLLGILQSGTVHSGPDLARELGVTTRCVRRDVDRLRELGYPVEASPGLGGGYRLAAGRALPPLLLDDAEGVAIAVALQVATASAVDGVEEPAVRALAKLDQVLPKRLAREVAAVAETTSVVPGGGPRVDVGVLLVVVRSIRDRERLTFAYAEGHQRRVEPARLVVSGGRWYLLAWDLERTDWRTFRLDRMQEPRSLGVRFAARQVPDAVARVREGVTQRAYAEVARIRFLAPASEVTAQVPPNTAVVEPDGPDASVLVAGADDLRWLLARVLEVDLPFEVLEPAWLAEEAARWAQRLRRASQAPAVAPSKGAEPSSSAATIAAQSASAAATTSSG